MTTASDRFQAYSPTHVVVLLIFVVGACGVVWAGRRLRGTERELLARRGFAVGIVCAAVPLQIYQFLPSDWDLGTSLPLALCDFAWMAAVYALWTRAVWAAALTYYWGLTLTIQGIITPSLAQNFPDPRFFGFWALHCLVVWSALFLTFGIDVRPTWRTYRIAVGLTTGWAIAVYVFNVVVGTNYGYLNHKPPSASILSLLGPWPAYVAAEIVIVCVVWALMTWPWVGSRSYRTAPLPGSQ